MTWSLPPPGAALARRLSYNASLDGLRALAVLAVCGYHMSALATGYVGVDCFLVLSGFLITSLLLAEWDTTGGISIPAFYVRRAYRLLPAFYVFVLVGTVLVLMTRSGERRQVFFEDALAALLYYANYWRVLHPETESSWFGHVWSLSLEEQFYLVWPICLVWLCGRSRTRAKLPWILVVAALSVLVWRNVLIAWGASPQRLYFALDTRADAFLLGCALGAFRQAGYSSTPRLLRLATKLGPFALLCLAWMTTGDANPDTDVTWLDRGGYTLVAALACLLVLSVDASGSSWWSRLLAARPLSGLGRISYGFYLWHYPVSAFGSHLTGRIGLPLAYGVTVAVSAGFAAVSYRVIEQPLQRSRPPWTSAAKANAGVGGVPE
ncbi:MAG TPA: acyltransferase [Polyangiales bacterium]|nr:acyltransferase [Polyangiales bacterium]